MKAIKFCKLLEEVINEVNAKHGVATKVELIPCEVTQICANGAHKDISTGRFASRSVEA